MDEIIQGSDAWFKCRVGKVTASKINEVMAKLKSKGEAAGRKNYRVQLAVERLTGQKAESFTSGPMLWGIDQEPMARNAYMFESGTNVEEIGFIDHPFIPMTGCSPDGTINVDGMIEIKCPNSATHVDWMLAGVVPSEHINQMMWQMECAQRQWCDFVSYDPRLPPDLQLFVRRIERDDVLIGEIKSEVIRLLAEVDALVAQLEALRG
jgi:putative phage-type endonuclease